MTQPVVTPPQSNPTAIVALVLGIVAVVGALLIGIRFSGYNALLYGALAVVFGWVAIIVGIVGGVQGARRGRGVIPASLGAALGTLPFIAVFVGRWLGEEYLGFPYPG